MSVFDYFRYQVWGRLHMAQVLFAFNYLYAAAPVSKKKDDKGKIVKIEISAVKDITRQIRLVKDARPSVPVNPDGFTELGHQAQAVNVIERSFGMAPSRIGNLRETKRCLLNAIDYENGRAEALFAAGGIGWGQIS